MYRTFILWGLLVAILVGCGPMVETPGDRNPSKPDPGRETVWTCLADEVAAGEIADSDTLILVVDRLKARSRISDVEKGQFDGKFPEIRSKRRDLDPAADAQILRSL